MGRTSEFVYKIIVQNARDYYLCGKKAKFSRPASLTGRPFNNWINFQNILYFREKKGGAIYLMVTHNC